MKKCLFLSFLFLHFVAISQDGSLDLSFGVGGKVTTSFESSQFYSNAVAIQGDGKVIVAGTSHVDSTYDFALLRYNINGSLDYTFGTLGKVTTSIGNDFDIGNSLVIQNDGKIIVAGYSGTGTSVCNFAMIRYNDSGAIDSAFGYQGKVVTDFGNPVNHGFAVAIQTDGRILVGGTTVTGNKTNFALARYNNDGSLDTSFANAGKISTFIGTGYDQLESIAIQKDGKILAGGYSGNGSYTDKFLLVRYTNSGLIDTTFGTNGKVLTSIGPYSDYCFSVAMQSDNKIVAGGFIQIGDDEYNLALVRYNTDGSLDSSFNSDGVVTTELNSRFDFGRAVAIQTNQKIILIGSIEGDFAVLRYNADGSLDFSFDTDGIVTTDFGFNEEAFSAVIQADGKIVVTGYSTNGNSSEIAVARYNGSIVGVFENVVGLNFIIFPNPSTGTFTINLDKPTNTKICVYDLLGNCIYNKESQKISNENIDLSSQSKGFYFVEVTANKMKSVKKIVVQ